MVVLARYVHVVSTPYYVAGIGEDGQEIISFCWVVVAEVSEDRYYTHEHYFANCDKDGAERLAERVRERSVIDLDHWGEGSPWDSYRDDCQTYEEEREEALYNESWGY